MNPPPRNRIPTIDTNITQEFSFSVASPPSPSYNDVPSLQISISPQTDISPTTSPNPSRTQPPPKANSTNRARTESRKLLAHVLDQLDRRTLPPSIFDVFHHHTETHGSENNFEVLLQTVKGAVNPKKFRKEGKGQASAGLAEDDSDEDGEHGFSTDATYSLMLQLKDLLSMSLVQNWHILDDNSSKQQQNDDDYETSAKSGMSPFRRTRNSLQPGGRRFRSHSPSLSDGSRTRTPELLSSCISTLASVVSEDCRYQIAYPRPSCPPNALQALTLDVAQFLLHTHRHDPNIISKIGFAMIPAFSTFRPEMHGRLLTFFETAIIRGVLEDLVQIQGISNITSTANDFEKPLNSAGSSVVAIHIDAVQEIPHPNSENPQWNPWSVSTVGTPKLQSTYGPSQSHSLNFLSSLFAPLLSAVLEFVDLEPKSDIRTDVLHRFCRLLRLIIETKLDAYSDVFQVVGYHTHKARRNALRILCAVWPEAVGHVVISRPFAKLWTLDENDYSSQQILTEHQFIPWRFQLSSSFRQDCRSCSQTINGFGLLCILCMCAVHFDCYEPPEGSNPLQYSMASDPSIRRMAVYRFSHIPLGRSRLRQIHTCGHRFKLINLFTLCLCIVCRQPLWGGTSQGFNCSSCRLFAHSHCLTASKCPPCSPKILSSDVVDIDWYELRRSCLNFYGDTLQLSFNELAMLSFEEISVIHSITWTQAQTIASGIALGSIVVTRGGTGTDRTQKYRADEFELHDVVRWCEDLLTSDKQQVSNVMDDYMEGNFLSRSEHFMMFDWTNLMYIRSILRSPYTRQPTTHSSSADLLSVSQPGPLPTPAPDGFSIPFEVVPLSHMRDALGQELNIHSDIIARLFLSHLHNLGLFNRIDLNPVLFNGDDVMDINCSFPLPFGLDLSPTVETLVAAVEGCLQDLDLSVSEVGLLFLVRRLWPNGLASDYALKRLARRVVSWIIAEDDHLALVLRDYLAKGRPLPGVRTPEDPVLWPPSESPRPVPSGSVNNGGDYLATRRALLSRYAGPWLLALHNLDPTRYAALLYAACVEVDSITLGTDDERMRLGINESQSTGHHDKVLRHITRLIHYHVVFTSFNRLLLHWLESTSCDLHEEPIYSFTRLFPREAEVTNSYNTSFEQGDSATGAVDPWRMITGIAAETKEGLGRSLRWLCLFASSGVEIPLTVFKTLSALTSRYDSSLAESFLLVKAAMVSTWLNSKGRQEIPNLISQLHERLSDRITAILKSSGPTNDTVSFIRVSLACCLISYGCDRTKLSELNIILEADIKSLPSRRKLNSRGSLVVDPVVIDPRLMVAIGHYIATDIEEISCLVGKFLYLFLMDSPYLESYEVDNFVLRNGRILATCAWRLYDIQHPEISTIRTHFLLRTLVVDSEPFRDILETCFLPTSSWERRLLATTRLFKVMLDVISPSFLVEDRQWRSSVADVFFYFFSSLWEDQREEIRLAVEACSATLLPAHLQAISVCWDELLSKSPILERLKLVSFLIQLHSYFPRWKVLSWDAIIEALAEDVYNETEPAAAHLSLYGLPSSSDPDLSKLHASIVFLSLQMIADGIAVDGFVLLKIKKHLVDVIGFHDISVVPSQSGQSFQVQFGEVNELTDIAIPCVNQLLLVMDAFHFVDVPPSAMSGTNDPDERPVTILVGSIFVDVFLTIVFTIQDLASLPVLTFKAMLETLCVIIYKHDFENRVLKHLQQTLRRAVTRALECISQDISYDLRQLALSVVQAFVRRWHSIMGSFIYLAIESTAKLVASQSQQHGQDALASQARVFLETTLTKYAPNGLFANLLKRPLNREFFVVLKQITENNAKSATTPPQNLRELLLRDIFTRVTDTDQLQNVLNNTQTYVEVVYHQNYSAELMQFVGQQLSQFARRTAEWGPGNVNSGPLLNICATLVYHNKNLSREILPYIDTVMRVLISRVDVGTECLCRLLRVANTMHQKTDNDAVVAQGVLNLLFEVLGDGLRLKARILPSTLKSMLEAITTSDTSGGLPLIATHLPSFLGLVDPAIHFLQNHPWQDAESDFAASIAVARMIMQVAGQDPTIMNKLSDHGTEKAAHTNLKVRSWSILSIAALLEQKENWYSALFAQLSSFSYAYHGSMRTYSQGSNSSESSVVDLNHAYIAIKLWILLAYRVSGSGDVVKDSQTFGVWNELWPPFEGLINQFECDAGGGLYLAVGTLVLSSVADLFVFIRALHTPIALHVSAHITTLNRLRQLGPSNPKASVPLTRALRYLSEPPPETSFDVLVNQAAKDIVAAEKLRILDAKVVQDRKGIERYRRDMRATT